MLAVILILLSLFVATPVEAVVNYGSGYYTNLCGTGTRDGATADLCNKGCTAGSGQCTSDKPYVVKWTCDGNLIECRANQSDYTKSQNISGTSCGKTVQMDVFNRKCTTALGWMCDSNDLLDFMVWYSGDCPNTTTTPTALPVLPASSCDDVRVISGNGNLVPSSVTVRAIGSDSTGSIQRYRFYFGDGKTEESSQSEIVHRYEKSGTFTVRVDILDGRSIWRTSNTCQTTVTVRSLPIESQKSDCSDLFVLSGDSSQVPATGKFFVTGFDNKGTLKKYKVDFGNGTPAESESNTFEHVYDSAGTYTVRGFIQDSKGNWKGGSGSCQKTFYVSTKPLVSQPATGTPTVITLFALSSGMAGMSLLILRKHRAK